MRRYLAELSAYFAPGYNFEFPVPDRPARFARFARRAFDALGVLSDDMSQRGVVCLLQFARNSQQQRKSEAGDQIKEEVCLSCVKLRGGYNERSIAARWINRTPHYTTLHYQLKATKDSNQTIASFNRQYGVSPLSNPRFSSLRSKQHADIFPEHGIQILLFH